MYIKATDCITESPLRFAEQVDRPNKLFLISLSRLGIKAPNPHKQVGVEKRSHRHLTETFCYASCALC